MSKKIKKQSESERINRIATELRDPLQILNQVHHWKHPPAGQTTDLGEIEETLARHPAVREVVVLTREETDDQKQTIAYVVADPRQSPTVEGRSRYLLPNRLAIVCPNPYEADLMYEEIFKNRTYLRHGISIQDGDCIFDVGANIGLFTLFVQQVAANTHVYSFEPAPTVFEALRINTGLYGANVTLFNYGISDKAKTALFTLYPHATGSSGFHADLEEDMGDIRRAMLKRHQNAEAPKDEKTLMNEQVDLLLKKSFTAETHTVLLRSLSDMLHENNIEHIDLLKIDVEKSECEVLSGIRKEDWGKIKQMVMEVHDYQGGLLDTITALLAEQGFTFIVDQDADHQETRLYMVYAVRRSYTALIAQPLSVGGDYDTLPITYPPLLTGNVLQDFLRKKSLGASALTACIFLDHLPRTVAGAIEHHALPAPDEADFITEDEIIFPRTATEQQLAGIWMDLLGCGQVSVCDDFFEIGGYSILAIKLLSRIREIFQVEIPMEMLFTGAFTIAESAKIIENHQIKQASREDISDILSELNDLSDDKVRSLLAAEMK